MYKKQFNKICNCGIIKDKQKDWMHESKQNYEIKFTERKLQLKIII